MKHFSIFHINKTLTKHQSLPRTSWFSERIKFISTIVTLATVIIMLISIITLYCECWKNNYGCLPKYIRPHGPPATSNDINLTTFSYTPSSQPHQVTPKVIQEILKSCNEDLATFEYYKC